jgi:transcription initiation factor TFIID subunit 2
MLGAEVDAIAKNQPDQPKIKKIKLPLRQPSPEKIGNRKTSAVNAEPPPPVHSNPNPVERKKAKAVHPLPPAATPNVDHDRPHPPADLPPTRTNSMPMKQKRARQLLLGFSKDPCAVAVSRIGSLAAILANFAQFMRPVDPIIDMCPTYLAEIKEPMDFGTITKKIDGKAYKTMGQLAYDIELVFAK